MDELPAGIHLVLAVGVGIDRVQALGQEHPALDLHQRGGHDEKFAGDLEVQLLHRVQDRDVLLRHRLDRDVVDVYLVLADQEEQQVERALEDLAA